MASVLRFIGQSAGSWQFLTCLVFDIQPLQHDPCKMLERTYNLLVRIIQSLGIKWAPLDVPLPRRLQTMAAAGWISLVLLGEATGILSLLTLLYSRYYLLALAYCFWMMRDIDICNKGGRRIEWVRNWSWWTYFRDYFPLKLVKTAELDPSKNYLLACFPHGVVCTGAFGAFATNALDWHRLYPGTTCTLLTLGGHFLVPFFRDLILALGACSSSAESMEHLLDKRRGGGRCVALIVGGAAESLNSQPGEYKVILNRRKGFIRLALKTGAPLVPVFSFGETDVFRPPPNPQESWLRAAQEAFRRLTGIAPMFPLGRGLFQYSFGIVPHRTPVTTVVGVPIEVEQNLDPSEETVEKLHATFTQKLVELFESEKSKYLLNHKDIHLVIS